MLNAPSNITWITNKYGTEKKINILIHFSKKKKQNENIFFSIFAKMQKPKKCKTKEYIFVLLT